jgi:hypothetical protein
MTPLGYRPPPAPAINQVACAAAGMAGCSPLFTSNALALKSADDGSRTGLFRFGPRPADRGRAERPRQVME